MALRSFETVIERAKAAGVKNRVVIAGADAENILLGAFQAQDAGFAELTLVGEAGKILPMLDRLELKDKPYRLVETYPGDNVTQVAIELINKGEGDILMRGNVQTREFLMPFVLRSLENEEKPAFKDYKTLLQEIVQKNPEEQLSYELVEERGPDHDKTFVVQVKINSNVIGHGEGKSKKAAEQMAAKEAVELMGE